MEWGFIILLALAIPVVIIWPLLIWAGAIRGLYMLVHDKVRERAKARQAQKTVAAQETATQNATRK
ncbi:MAG: hypothetical protein MUO92_05210 [Dehalococcoidales bacterium]|nr:hypothetical protein [Dehalococcoidales bacterium]